MIATMGRHARAPLTGYLVDEASQGGLGRNPRPDHASPASSASLGHGVARLEADSSPATGCISPSTASRPEFSRQAVAALRVACGLRGTCGTPFRSRRDERAALTGPPLPVRDRSWFEAALFPPRSDGSPPFPPSRERRHSNSAPRAPIRPGWRRAFRSPRG